MRLSHWESGSTVFYQKEFNNRPSIPRGSLAVILDLRGIFVFKCGWFSTWECHSWNTRCRLPSPLIYLDCWVLWRGLLGPARLPFFFFPPFVWSAVPGDQLTVLLPNFSVLSISAEEYWVLGKNTTCLICQLSVITYSLNGYLCSEDGRVGWLLRRLFLFTL